MRLTDSSAGVLAGTSPSVVASDVVRGIGRLFARNNVWCLPEMPLRSGRRADLMGIDAKGHVVIVEVKVSRADLLGDGKWTDYLEYCDRFYWGLAPGLDRACLETEPFLPDSCGVIIADGYDAEILRPAPTRKLAPARRKVEVERLARAAMRRLVSGSDPHTLRWADEDSTV
ncbi:MmcB family DNA repair protein [Novosphingobium sp. M1R2S20]|uniref:MmcB family DNA repair protein n=1 Tax=Novosphingobium rhizovicinum TaxID=3228928 RepID=A0ABV3R9A8_9SPHN